MTYKEEQEKLQNRNTILALASKKGQVIYGQQSVNAQLQYNLRKETKDYDILTSNSKGSAYELASELNRKYGYEKFKVEPALHRGTFKVKDNEGNTIADYTQTTKKPKTKNILGVKYATLDYQKNNIRKSLKNELANFRHEKDRDVLRRIKEGTKKWFSFRF